MASTHPKHLVIVESPAKAKTIEQYLGKDFRVKSSYGHIRDLPRKGLNVDVAKNFQPTYQISSDKEKILKDLDKSAKQAETVWLASDEDREGEAIAWHLSESLSLQPSKTKRIVFHEITKPAIDRAIENPRSIDMHLVDAQQARRILDRLVGYELSPVLWKKVRPGLSAGRVQSVAVRLVVEREREIRDFKPEQSFKVTAVFQTDKGTVQAELDSRLTSETEAQAFLESLVSSTFTVESLTTKPSTRNPSPPFTTSSLQQEAARKLGFSVRQTMVLAQRLYENGHITYMRTDSVVLSNQALAAAKDFIVKTHGQKYHQQRQYKTKTSGAQEAHEAIRPTNFANQSAGADNNQKKLYELIWKRAIASQMAPAELNKTELSIAISNRAEHFIAKGEVLVFDGFLNVYGGGKDDVILPEVTQGQKLDASELKATQTFSKALGRYSEASLVKKLEELGIGRPSTYAPTISTIQDRGYIEKGELAEQSRDITTLTLIKDVINRELTQETFGAERAKLLPTPLAEQTTDFLTKHFAPIVDYDFTAKAEEEFDDIADGKLGWVAMLKDFYDNFHPLVKESDQVSRQESSQARLLGSDPKDKLPIYARYGRFGPMLQKGESDTETKPQFATMPEGETIETVTLDKALAMFALPRELGKTPDGKDVITDIGRYGPYIKIDKKFVSIKGLDPLTITLNEALDVYKDAKDKQSQSEIKVLDSGIKVLNGRFGPYVTDGKKNARIPKTIEPKDITEAEATELLEKAKTRKFTKKSSK